MEKIYKYIPNHLKAIYVCETGATIYCLLCVLYWLREPRNVYTLTLT